MAYIVTKEAKYLTPGQKFTFRNRKTFYYFIEDNGLTYTYRDEKHNEYESDYYGLLVDCYY